MNILFFKYLFPTALAIILFYGCYLWLLRKESLFQLNRFFLLFALVFSFALPFIHLDNSAPIQQINYNTLSEQVIYAKPIVTINVPETSFDWNIIWKIIYFCGVVLMSAKVLVQLARILFLVVKFGIRKENRHSIVWMQNNMPHFSFFRLIFINQNKIEEGEDVSSIILHEAAHIRQWHCIDLLLLETATTMQWFNPVMWLYKRSLKGVHEYLADRAVLKTGTEKIMYCQLLFKQSTGFRLESLTNSFYYPSLKNRIMMITQKQNTRKNIVKLCFTLPVFVILFMIFACENKFEKELSPKEYEEQFYATYNTHPDQPAVYKNGNQDIGADFASLLNFKDFKSKITTNSVIKITFLINEKGEVKEISSYEFISQGSYIGEDFPKINAVQQMGNWKPATQNGHPVKSTYIIDVADAVRAALKAHSIKIYTPEEYMSLTSTSQKE